MAKLALVTGPVGRVCDVADLKLHTRIDDSAEDSLVQHLSDMAEDHAETFTGRKFLDQTWYQYFDEFDDPLYLAYGPVDSITAITYTDTDGDSQTLSTDIYETGELYGAPIIRRKYNQSWESTRGHEDVVRVEYVVGYGTAADVPLPIVQAIRIYAAWQYRNRDLDTPLPAAFQQLLRPYRLLRHYTGC